ncbi:hypothetical protein D3C81_1960010 [compost metagenome]
MVAQDRVFAKRCAQLCQNRYGIRQILGIAVHNISGEADDVRLGLLDMPGQPLQIVDILVEAQMHIAEMNQPGTCERGRQLRKRQLPAGHL